MSRVVLLASLFALCSLPLVAQMGDARDKAGTTQKPPPAAWVRPAPILSPAESLKTFTLPPGFHIELIAAEPLVREPVALDFGPDGKIWVAEMRSYMPDVDGKGENAPNNRVVVLEDTDHDGRMDKSTVYMDGLGLVRSVKVLRDGVLIGDPPNLWFTRDTDGDGKADEKIAIATDFSVRERNPEEGANALIWGLDNWIGGSSFGRRLRLKDGHWISEPAVVRGQWGQSMDDYGRMFTNSNENYSRVDLISDRYPARNSDFVPGRAGRSGSGVYYQLDADQSVWPSRPTPGINRGYWENRLRADGTMQKFDAACGPCIYRGDNFPAEFYGNYFCTEPAGHVVRRAILTDKDGVLSAHNAYEKKEFLSSSDERFRPVNAYTAPDGTLYVVDLHRGILQHRQYMTTYLRQQILERGLDKGLGYGRIYRVVSDAKQPGPAPALAQATTPQLVAALAHPNGWWRDTAQRLLVENGDKSAAPKLRELALANTSDEIIRLKALWTMEGLGVLPADLVATVMEAESPKLRAAAIRLSEPFLAQGDAALTAQALRHARDPSPEVRLQLALSLGEAPVPTRTAALAGLLHDHPDAAFLVSAAVSGLSGNGLSFVEHILQAADWHEAPERFTEVFNAFGGALAQGRKSATLDRLLQLVASSTAPAVQRLALLEGVKSSGVRTIDAKPAALDRVMADLEPRVARAARELNDQLVWPGKFGSAPVPLTAAEQQLFEKGKVAYATICANCHQPDGRGREGVAAPLVDSPWVLGPEQFLARIVLKGKTGKTTVTMPPLEMLGNETLAGALTYIRRSWGHNAAPVNPNDIERVREAIILRSQPFTETELTALREGR